MTDEPEKTDATSSDDAPERRDEKADAPTSRASSPSAPPANETPEEKKARLARVIAEAKAKKEAAAQAGGAQASGSATPATPASPVTSDAEKAAKIAEAKAKAAALKASAVAKPTGATPAASSATGATASAPKAPVKKKEDAPAPKDASDNALVKRLRAKFGDAITEASEFLGQLSVRVARGSIVEVCEFLKRDAETPFDYLCDLTCVHYPDNFDAPFEIVYNLYSISRNARVRLKVSVGAT
jgi:NADH-quinone oxidoreductase subunit C